MSKHIYKIKLQDKSSLEYSDERGNTIDATHGYFYDPEGTQPVMRKDWQNIVKEGYIFHDGDKEETVASLKVGVPSLSFFNSDYYHSPALKGYYDKLSASGLDGVAGDMQLVHAMFPYLRWTSPSLFVRMIFDTGQYIFNPDFSSDDWLISIADHNGGVLPEEYANTKWGTTINLGVDFLSPYALSSIYNRMLPFINSSRLQAFSKHPTYISAYHSGDLNVATPFNSGVFLGSELVASEFGNPVKYYFPRPKIKFAADLGTNDYRLLASRYKITANDPFKASTVNDVTKKSLLTRQGIKYKEIPTEDPLLTELQIEGEPYIDLSLAAKNLPSKAKKELDLNIDRTSSNVKRDALGITKESYPYSYKSNLRFASILRRNNIDVGTLEGTFEPEELYLVFDTSKMHYYPGYNFQPVSYQPMGYTPIAFYLNYNK